MARIHVAWRRWGVQFILAVLAIYWLVSVFQVSLDKSLERSKDPYQFHDDARTQIYPYDRYQDPELFPNDYLGQYAIDTMPLGYRGLYVAAAKVWDHRALSKALPYALFLVLVTALSIGTMKWGKVAAAWVVVALCLSTDLFFGRMGGGLPRGFAFPILACGAAALIHGRMLALAVITCIGASFYAVSAVPLGLALAVVLLLFPARHRGSAADWSFKRRFITVAATGLLAALLLLPTSLAMRKYGGFIRPADVGTYPEAGPSGRFLPGDRPPYKDLLTAIAEEGEHTLAGAGKPFSKFLEDESVGKGERARTRSFVIFAILGMTALGFLRLASRDSGARRLLMLAAAATAGHLIAKQVAPYFYLPQRYVIYPLPVLLMIMLPAAAFDFPASLGRRLDRAWIKTGSVIAAGAICLYLLGGHGSDNAMYSTRVDARAKIYPFIAKLPKDAMIAGWPTSLMDNIPYVSRRQVFVSFETHIALNKIFVQVLRERMRAVIDAYFATDPRPLLTLRDKFGATHFILDTRHFTDKRPEYFQPFDRWAREAYTKAQRDGFEAMKQVEHAAVFREGTVVVLDLSKISGL